MGLTRTPDAEFEAMLTGGHPNSLGRTLEVVDAVRSQPQRFDALLSCYFSENDVVRLRVSNAVKRLTKESTAYLKPHVGLLLTDIAAIEQPSTQWTLAELFTLLDRELSSAERRKAQTLVKRNLSTSSDWIVLNKSIDALMRWARRDDTLAAWLRPELQRLSGDTRKSVANRATKALDALGPD